MRVRGSEIEFGNPSTIARSLCLSTKVLTAQVKPAYSSPTSSSVALMTIIGERPKVKRRYQKTTCSALCDAGIKSKLMRVSF